MMSILGDDVELRATSRFQWLQRARGSAPSLQRGSIAVRRTSPDLQRVCLVHGEPGPQAALTERLAAKGYHVKPGPAREGECRLGLRDLAGCNGATAYGGDQRRASTA